MSRAFFVEEVPESGKIIHGIVGDPGVVTISTAEIIGDSYLQITSDDDGKNYMALIDYAFSKIMYKEDIQIGEKIAIQWTGEKWVVV